jgi:hypothetical protein
MAAKSKQAAAATEYSPEIEVRRADYEQLAEALIHIAAMETGRVGYAADLGDSPFEDGNDGAIIKGVAGHLRALWSAIDWYSPRTLRKFYAELRLWNDKCEMELKRRGAESQAEKAAG